MPSIYWIKPHYKLCVKIDECLCAGVRVREGRERERERVCVCERDKVGEKERE